MDSLAARGSLRHTGARLCDPRVLRQRSVPAPPVENATVLRAILNEVIISSINVYIDGRGRGCTIIN